MLQNADEKHGASTDFFNRCTWCLIPSSHYARLLLDTARAAEALPLAQTALATHEAASGPNHPWTKDAAPPPAPKNPTSVEAMAWRLRTPQGKQLYGLRKQTPEPVFGIIKSVMGFRQFLLRGLDCVRGEWRLVTMAWNIKRMHALSLG